MQSPDQRTQQVPQQQISCGWKGFPTQTYDPQCGWKLSKPNIRLMPERKWMGGSKPNQKNDKTQKVVGRRQQRPNAVPRIESGTGVVQVVVAPRERQVARPMPSRDASEVANCLWFCWDSDRCLICFALSQPSFFSASHVLAATAWWLPEQKDSWEWGSNPRLLQIPLASSLAHEAWRKSLETLQRNSQCELSLADFVMDCDRFAEKFTTR